MTTLYYSPGTCSMAIHVMLNEVGAEFKLKPILTSKGEQKTPEYLLINPRGAVPALQDGDRLLLECAAILMYLVEKHQSPLLPASGEARNKAIEWLMFANATMHPAYAKAFFANKNCSDAAAKDELLKVAISTINTLWADVENTLKNQPYVCGEECTVADILLTVIANWSTNFPDHKIILGERCKQLFKRVTSRPSYQKALASEQVEYKVAA